MPHPDDRGGSLPELLIACTLLAGLAIASAPVAVQVGGLLARGRALLEGTHLAATRRALSDSLPCLAAAGTDTSRRTVLAWQLEPRDSALRLTSVIRDRGSRWPAETLATILVCTP